MRWLLILISINVWANDLENAVVDARDFMAGKATTDHIVNANLQEVPKFAGSSPKEGSFYDEPNLLKERSEAAAIVDDVAQHLKETASTRPRFKIDPATDPLFKSRDLDPSLTIKGDSDDPPAAIQGSVEKTCEEGGEDVTYECLENRIVTVNVPIKTATLTVNHLGFSPVNVQESYVVRAGNFWRSTQYGSRDKLVGYDVTLPKEINAFKEKFCQGFPGLDSVTGQIFNIDCSRIVGFKINSGSLSEDSNNFYTRTPTNALNITLQHKTYEGEAIDEWTGCGQFEELVDQGL